jgi:DNA-binding response OmpR family regulator
MGNPIAQAWSYVLDEPCRILVVDDDPILCEFARVHVSSPTTEVETAQNGERALQLLISGAFDIVLVDIEMPVLDGFALLGGIRSHPRLRDLPVMMLTAHEDIASIDQAYRLGATAFATKPVNWRNLTYQIRYVLRAQRTETNLRSTRDGMNRRRFSDGDTRATFAQECRDALSSILTSINSCRVETEAPAPLRLRLMIEEIEASTRELLARCDAISGKQTGGPVQPVALASLESQ